MGLARSDRMSGWLLESRSSLGNRRSVLSAIVVMTGMGTETESDDGDASVRGLHRLTRIGVPRGGGGGAS